MLERIVSLVTLAKIELSFGLSAAIVIGSIVGSFALGAFAANALRMKDYGWKIGLILCSTILSLLIIGQTWDSKTQRFELPKGVDLEGGVILVYEVDEKATELAGLGKPGDAANRRRGDAPSFDINALIEALKRRINPTGTREIAIRPYGDKQVEIIVPKVGDAEMRKLMDIISRAGVLQFRIVANRRDHKTAILLAEEQARDPDLKKQKYVLDSGKQIAYWAKVGRDDLKPRTAKGNQHFKTPLDGDIIRDAATGDIITSTGGDNLPDFLAAKGIENIEVLMFADDGFNVTGAHLGAVFGGMDRQMNPCVRFSMKGEGESLFGGLTEMNRPTSDGFHRRLGILLDNELLSAPNLNDKIDKNGEITGSFSQEEVDFLVGILRAGSLPVVLKRDPVSMNQISALLGEETIRKGTTSIWVSMLAVLIFMLGYYRFSGFVACFALLLNLILIVACMVAIKAPFTLPGLAGLVLTVGMAVDANVLIYERMREEIARGSALRLTIRNGFDRAMSTIIDSNLTTVLSGVILYAIGTDQLKGFAVTLILGLVISMFTAIFVSRVCFDIFERQKWLKQINMSSFLGATNFDFMKLGKPAIIASIVISVVGLIGCVVLGKHILDTDLAGGTSVAMQTLTPVSAEEVRRVVEPEFEKLKIEYTVSNIDPDITGKSNKIKVDSSFKEVTELEELLSNAFRGKLLTYEMNYTPIKETGAKVPGGGEPNGEKSPAKTEPAKTETSGAEKKESGGCGDELTLALADDAKPDEPKSDSPKAEAPKADSGTSDSPKPEAPSADAAKSDEKPAESKASEGKPADAKDSTPSAADAKPTDKSSSEFKPPEPAAPPARVGVRSETTLTFSNKIDAESLQQQLEKVASTVGVEMFAEQFVLSNPEWDGLGTTPYKEWTLRVPLDAAKTSAIVEKLKAGIDGSPVWHSTSKVGGQIAGKAQSQALLALALSCVGIVIYVWFRFQHLIFGIAAVVALVHDVIVTVAFIAFSHWLAGALHFLQVEEFRISMSVIAALLTIIGYSINDTIVIFDRMREVKGKSPEITGDMINLSVNQTLSRTILTFFATFLVVVVLYFFGGDGIHAFAFSMVIGTISGMYSTVFIASPLVLWIAGKKAAA